MHHTTADRRLYGALVIYCTALFTTWGLWELLCYPALSPNIGAVAGELAGGAVKLLVWTLPALWLVWRFEQKVYVSLKGMFTAKFRPWPYLLILVGIFAYNLIMSYKVRGCVDIKPLDPIGMIGTVWLVGVTEEIVFRGWLLNATLPRLKQWPAALVNAGLFTAIHIPIWVRLGFFSDVSSALVNMAGIFLLGLVFAWVFIKSRNVLVVMALHMAWNFANQLFMG